MQAQQDSEAGYQPGYFRRPEELVLESDYEEQTMRCLEA
jgi:hypothetical protein